MMCERAVSRSTKGELLIEKQMIQEMIAESSADIRALRLMALHSAWVWDDGGRVEGPGRDRGAQVLGRPGAPRRDRPRHPGARRAGLVDGPPARHHVRHGPADAHRRRRRRGAQVVRRQQEGQGLQAGRAGGRAATCPPGRPSCASASPSSSTTRRRTSDAVEQDESDGLMARADEPGRRRRGGAARIGSVPGSPSTSPARAATVEVTQIAGGSSNLTFQVPTASTTGCCAGRRCATSSPPRTTWAASTGCSRRSRPPTCRSRRRSRRATTSR